MPIKDRAKVASWPFLAAFFLRYVLQICLPIICIDIKGQTKFGVYLTQIEHFIL